MDQPKHIPAPEHAKINQFAIRCFRDTGDADYIAARLAIRSHLPGPFLWSAEQAIEKYLKCVLMLNRQTTNELSHKIGVALETVNSTLPFKILLNKDEQEIFDHIAECEGDRYLIHSISLDGIEVIKLDRLVWRLRQYCLPLDVRHYADAPSAKVLLERVGLIEAGMNGPASNGHIQGGFLETVLADRTHPAHDALVWKNMRFSMVNRKHVIFTNSFQAINAPLFLNPELAVEAAKWMKIHKNIVAGAQILAKRRLEEAKNTKALTYSEDAHANK